MGRQRWSPSCQAQPDSTRRQSRMRAGELDREKQSSDQRRVSSAQDKRGAVTSEWRLVNGMQTLLLFTLHLPFLNGIENDNCKSGESSFNPIARATSNVWPLA